MKVHDQARFFASAAATGGLTSVELTAWNDHIAICPSCRLCSEKELTLAALLRQSLQSEGPGPGFERRMVAEFRQTRQTSRDGLGGWTGFPIPWLAAAGCTALVLVAGLGWWACLPRAASTLTNNGSPALVGLPLPAERTVHFQLPGSRITSIERVKDEGEIFYDVETTAPNGTSREISVKPDGTLVSAETTMDELPEGVRAAITAVTGRDPLDEVDELFDGGEKTYVVDQSTKAGERELTFTDNGALASAEVKMADLSPGIKKSITTLAAGRPVEEIEKSFEDGSFVYLVTLLTGDKESSLTFNPDGSIASMQIDSDSLPPAVRASLAAQIGADKLQEVEQTTDADGHRVYEATVKMNDGFERAIAVSPDGSLVSREVRMAETPTSVSATISRIMLHGKIEEIDQCFTSSDHPYEVQGQRDGKPFDFLVSPNGRFLGLED